VNILRRLPLSRLLLLCALVVALGASATAIAFALGSGPTPPPKPLAQAVHDALDAAPVEGVSASVKLTNHLLEGSELASGGGEAGQLSQSPLLSGAAGRLWIAKDGRVRLELQAEKGDTQVLYDGHTVKVYDAASNTLYEYTPPPTEDASASIAQKRARARFLARKLSRTLRELHGTGSRVVTVRAADLSSAHLISAPKSKTNSHEVPSVAKIEEAIAKLGKNAIVSGATPTDIAGQPAYTARISPKESGSLIGGAELSWDAVHGVPLRAALYSSTSSSPVIELAASEVSYGPVDSSVFEFTPPANAKVEEVKLPSKHDAKRPDSAGDNASKPKITAHGHGITGVAVLESKAKPGEKALQLPESLPKVKVNGTTAAELPTALGTLLGFERSGVRYLLVGAVTPADIEAVAKGL
jgi:outer membrane lipoprotein-sorting protein